MFRISPTDGPTSANALQGIPLSISEPSDGGIIVYNGTTRMWDYSTGGGSGQTGPTGATGVTGPTGATGPTASIGTYPTSRILYVSKIGDDTTGNGTIVAPFLTVFKAIDVALGIVASYSPVCISIAGGVYVEDNSVAPKAITTTGISLEGDTSRGVIIKPFQPLNSLFTLASRNINIENLRFEVSDPNGNAVSSSASMIVASGTFSINISNCVINYFQTAISISGNGNITTGMLIQQCVFNGNTVACHVEGVQCVITNSTITGSLTPTPGSQTGVEVTGSSTTLYLMNSIVAKCGTGVHLSSNCYGYVNASNTLNNTVHFLVDTQADFTAEGISVTKMDTGHTCLIAHDTGTAARLSACYIDGRNYSNVVKGTGCVVDTGASIGILNSYMSGCVLCLQCGKSDNTDTASTLAGVSSSTLVRNTAAYQQYGTTTMRIGQCSIDTTNSTINDPTNVVINIVNAPAGELIIGSLQNTNTELLHIATSAVYADYPYLDYRSNLYGFQTSGSTNPANVAYGSDVISKQDASVMSITQSLTNTASLKLFSDTSATVGDGTLLRGWSIEKSASDATLDFKYQNNNPSGQADVTSYSLLSMNGYNKTINYDSASYINIGDVSMYRYGAGVLGITSGIRTASATITGLTASRGVVTDASSNLVSSATTATEIGYLSGVTSSVQTQLDGKLSLSGGTMSGTLTTAAGTSTTPSLAVGSSAVGLASSTSNRLDFITSGVNRANIASDGTYTITGNVTLSNFGAGVLQTSSGGVVSSGNISGTQITDTTITNAKLATASSGNNNSYIVARDSSGNFTTNMITILGSTTASTDVATKSYVDSVAGTGLVPLTPAIVVAVANSAITGLLTIDGVTLVDSNRVLLVAQNTASENGVWVAHAGAWTRPTDFNTGNTAGNAYVLITQGTDYTGSSWLCNTPNAVIGTDSITFVQFSLPVNVDGVNDGTGQGSVYKSTVGTTLNFRTLNQGTHVTISNSTDTVDIGVDAVSTNTVSTIVARDGSGNFSAGTITANLTGTVTGSASLNVLKAGDTMTGTLIIPAGSAVAPSLKFTGGTNTGFSMPTTDNISIGTNGTRRINIGDTGAITIDNLSSTGIVHNSSAGVLSTSLIVNADVDPSAAIVDTKLATISTAGKVSNSATTATNADTALAIVSRDASGNFSAGMITANLTGTVTGSASLNVLKSGDTMTGALVMPVNGGSATTPSLQFGSATRGFLSTSSGVSIVTNSLEKFVVDSSGSCSIKNFITAGVVHNDDTGVLTTSLIVNADIDTGAAIVDTKLATISTAGKVSNSATTATSANTASAIVARDGSGNFSAGTITATINGGISGGAVSATTLSASSTVTFSSFSTAGILHNDSSGVISSSLIVNADVDPSAAIVDTKLATISTAGKVSNSATTATSANTASAIVARDGSGNFSAGTITATITGSSSLNVLKAGDTMSGTLNMGSNPITAVSAITVSGTTNQIVLGTTNTVTINSSAPTSSQTYNINPFAGSANFLMESTTGSSHIPISYESASTTTGATTVTAAQLATGIITLTGNITLPTGANIAANASLAPFNVLGTVFKVLFCNVGATARTLAGATGTTLVGGTALSGNTSRLVYFINTGTNTWNVY